MEEVDVLFARARADCVRGVAPAAIISAHLLTATDGGGSTLLHLACEHRHAAVVTALLHAGAQPDARDKQLKTALMTAAAAGAVECVAVLLAHSHAHGGAAAAAVHANHQKKNGWTALMYAAKAGSVECVNALLEAGARVHDVNKEGADALYLAARESGSVHILRALLDAGAQADVRCRNGRFALLAAAAAGHTQAVPCIVAAAPSMLLAVDASGVTAFHDAAQNGHAATAAQLWSLCAPEQQALAVCQVDVTGRTALHFAVASGSDACVAWCLAHGWAVDARDERLATPLYYACIKNDAPIVRILLEHGADVCLGTLHRPVLHACLMSISSDDCEPRALLLCIHALLLPPREASASRVGERTLPENDDCTYAACLDDAHSATPAAQATLARALQSVDDAGRTCTSACNAARSPHCAAFLQHLASIVSLSALMDSH